jgi:hypothetical protein
MRARRIWLTAFATYAMAGTVSSAELTELPPPSGAGVERGVATLRCNLANGLVATSRATVLDVGDAAHSDVLLTTAHGLPAAADDIRRACRILARGKAHSIQAVWRGGGRTGAPEHDWAVLMTARIPGGLRRWRAAAAPRGWLERLVADEVPVRLVLRYADAAQSDCRLEALTADRLLAHSCTAYPGTSGAPLVVGVEHQLVMIGLHVGSQQSWDGRRIDMVSVARPIDAAVIAAIEAAAVVASQPKRRRAGHRSID